MALLLGDLPWAEQVELDSPYDVRDAGLAGFSGREVAGLLGFAGAGPVGAVADEESGMRIFSRNVARASSGWSAGKSSHGAFFILLSSGLG